MAFFSSRVFAVLVLLAGGAGVLVPGNARAETYHTCAGFIDSVPATITSQGVWCLRKDLSTAMIGGIAINIAANNVTIDCNDFKVGGLAAGDYSTTKGIVTSRQNVTVRNCNVRGFYFGIDLHGAGHLVEDNRLDNNLLYGIRVTGENGLVQRNRVYDTGGTRFNLSIHAINVSGADVIDNTVAGMFSTGTGSLYGVRVLQPQVIRNNRIRGLPGWDSFAILADGLGSTVEGNLIYDIGSRGIMGRNVDVVCRNNVVVGAPTPFVNCLDNGGNISL